MGRLWAAALVFFMGWCCAGEAYARVAEVRLSAAVHNVLDRDHKEGGANIAAEAVFTSPGALRVVGAPRPFVIASLNTKGKSNFVGAGVSWRIPLVGRWKLEPSIAYIVHDGEIENPFPRTDPRSEAFERTHILYGSRDLFRECIALEREVRPDFAAQIYVAHMSHGRILGTGRNQGAEEIGMRLVWRLGRS